jgi:hypothetical protein
MPLKPLARAQGAMPIAWGRGTTTSSAASPPSYALGARAPEYGSAAVQRDDGHIPGGGCDGHGGLERTEAKARAEWAQS